MSLRTSLIKLAQDHPELRKELLPLLKEGAGEPTPTNIWALEQEVGESPDGIIRKIKPSRVPHIRRCLDAGLLEAAPGEKNAWRLSEKGKKALTKTASLSKVALRTRLDVNVVLNRSGMKTEDNVHTTAGFLIVDAGNDRHKLKFIAKYENIQGLNNILQLELVPTVSGPGAEVVLNMLKSTLQEILNTKAISIID